MIHTTTVKKSARAFILAALDDKGSYTMTELYKKMVTLGYEGEGMGGIATPLATMVRHCIVTMRPAIMGRIKMYTLGADATQVIRRISAKDAAPSGFTNHGSVMGWVVGHLGGEA